MIVLTLLAVFMFGLFLGLFFSQRISEKLNKNSYENPRKQMVKKIWSFTYVDIEGNRVEVPIQNHSFELSTKNYLCKKEDEFEELSECCGKKLLPPDFCSDCGEHTGQEVN